MKKLLAIVLALVMMFAVCVPAFATTVRGNESQANPVEATIKTNTELPEGTYAYVVEIPSTTVIPWANDYTEFTYRIMKTQLDAGKRLQVKVASSDDKSVLESEATSATIPYSFSRLVNADPAEYEAVENLSYTTTREVITTAIPRTFYITIAANAWNVPLAEYADVLNFQIDIVDAEVTPAP